MKLFTFRARFAAVACIVFAGLWSSAQALERKNVRSVDMDNYESGDSFVNRVHSDIATNDYKSGQLGILLTSYAREPLYLAYRALTLDRAKLVQQDSATPKLRYTDKEIPGGVDVWVKARKAVTNKALSAEIQQDKNFAGHAFGGYLNCGNSAFNLAATTLQSLVQGGRYNPTEIGDWIDAQDKVFQLCGDGVNQAANVFPVELAAAAPALLRALRQYQIAAAHFYAGDFSIAFQRFTAIAADAAHPMRDWAELAAMRALLRKASLDNSLALEINKIKASQDTAAAKEAAIEGAQTKQRHLMEQVFQDIQARASRILANNDLRGIHQATRNLVPQAAKMIAPELLYSALSTQLGKFESDAVNNLQVEKWSSLGDRLFDYGGRTGFIASLRQQHPYFDWMRTVQGCTDNSLSPNFQGNCAQEHRHALAKWQSSKSREWLVAVWMTAHSASPALERAFASALEVAGDAMEYPTLRYHMARVLRLSNRSNEARVVLEPVFAQWSTPKRLDRSARSLLQQEGLANSETMVQALPYLRRVAGQTPAADVDALLNRHLASEDLLKLAQHPGIDKALKDQLLTAAWWRADMAGNAATATSAARSLSESRLSVSPAAAAYLATTDPKERQFFLAKAAMDFRISPQVYWVSKDWGARRKAGPADYWCSFDAADSQRSRALQRSPEFKREISENSKMRDAEITALKSVGTAADWLARIAIHQSKALSVDPAVRPMLKAVVDSQALSCASVDSDKLIAAAQLAWAGLPATASSPSGRDELVRAAYDKMLRDTQGDEEFLVSHILLKTQAEARSVLTSLHSGGSFEEIARAQSIDPSGQKNGGSLGWSNPEHFVAPFSFVVRLLRTPGLHPIPIQTAFGWHVVRVLGVRPFVPPSFAQARPFIEQKLRKDGVLP